MKLEKVNDHQIRCTLTKADLADRHMKLSELAYGTEKAKSLFRDMMQQASYEFGFEAEDIPLMIEAIPLSGDCIVLIITKVEDPEELDTRFSKFAPEIDSSEEESDSESASAKPKITADDVIDLFRKIHSDLTEATSQLTKSKENKKTIEISTEEDLTKFYEFEDLDSIIRLSHVLKGFYDGDNSLYRCTDSDNYYLLIHKSSHSPEDFNRICNIFSEYSRTLSYTRGGSAFLAEHGKPVIIGNALQKLSEIEM